jgi:hypothetical protein
VNHKHRWGKPYFITIVGWVKRCRAKNCPRRMKSVKMELVK